MKLWNYETATFLWRSLVYCWVEYITQELAMPYKKTHIALEAITFPCKDVQQLRFFFALGSYYCHWIWFFFKEKLQWLKQMSEHFSPIRQFLGTNNELQHMAAITRSLPSGGTTWRQKAQRTNNTQTRAAHFRVKKIHLEVIVADITIAIWFTISWNGHLCITVFYFHWNHVPSVVVCKIRLTKLYILNSFMASSKPSHDCKQR